MEGEQVADSLDGPGTLQVAVWLSVTVTSPPQGSEVNVIGIGTNVVTCPKQPSMGCVYKVKTMFGPRWDKAGRSWVVGDRVPLSKHPLIAAGVCGRPASNKADGGPGEANPAREQGCLPVPRP